jgi:lipopolysaccharide export system ATP-binding protein
MGDIFMSLQFMKILKAIAEITIKNKSYQKRKNRLSVISQFELEPITNVKADFLSGGQKKKLSHSFVINL